MKKKGLLLTLIATFALSGCSFNPGYSEELEDVSSIYRERRHPAFVTLDYAIKRTFGEDYFGAASKDFKLKAGVYGEDKVLKNGGYLKVEPGEVAFRSSGLEGDASSLKSALTVEDANVSVEEKNVTVRLSEDPISLGVYSVGQDCYYDFGDLATIDKFSEEHARADFRRKIVGAYSESFASMIGMIPLAIEGQATSFSKNIEERYKEDPSSLKIKENDGTYELDYSVPSASDIKDLLLVYNAFIFSTPMEIPLGEGEDAPKITITKEQADRFVKGLFDGLTINKYDCILVYNTNGIISFSLDLDFSFSAGTFELNIEELEEKIDIRSLVLGAKFDILDESRAVPELPEHLEEFSPISLN